jgi:hypothetical protein
MTGPCSHRIPRERGERFMPFGIGSVRLILTPILTGQAIPVEDQDFSAIIS